MNRVTSKWGSQPIQRSPGQGALHQSVVCLHLMENYFRNDIFGWQKLKEFGFWLAHLLAPLVHWKVGHGQSKHRWRDRQWGEEAEGEGRCLWAGAIFPACPDPCSRKAEKNEEVYINVTWRMKKNKFSPEKNHFRPSLTLALERFVELGTIWTSGRNPSMWGRGFPFSNNFQWPSSWRGWD